MSGDTKIKITTGNSGESVACGETSEILVPGYVQYILGGKVVGSVGAKFDIRNMPPELVGSFVNNLQGKRVNINGVAHIYWPDKYRDPMEVYREERAAEKAARDALPWWRRWFW
jgi:hypothetical protein